MAGLTPSSPQGQDVAGRARLEAWISLGVGIGLLVFTPSYQPLHPVVQLIPGLIAAVGFALGVSAFRFGSRWTRLVAGWAVLCNLVMLLAVGQELF